MLGALVPYWSLYLDAIGFSSKEIGILTAILTITRIIAPNLWSWLGNKLNDNLKVVRLGCLGAALTFPIVFLGSGLWPMVLMLFLFTIFWNGVLGQFEVVCLSHIPHKPTTYGRIRLWGSLSFIFVVNGLGSYFNYWPVLHLPFWMMGILMLVLINVYIIPSAESHQVIKTASTGLWQLLKKKEVIAFFFSSCLLQVSHGPFYTFFSLYLEDFGYSKPLIGWFWTLGIGLEILLFFFMPQFFRQFNLRLLALWSLALTVLRWVLTAKFPQYLAVLAFAQTLHGFSYGVYHACAIEFIRRAFQSQHHGQGHAVYNGFSYGLGGAFGAFCSGLIWDQNTQLAFYGAAIAACLAWIIMGFGFRGELVEK